MGSRHEEHNEGNGKQREKWNKEWQKAVPQDRRERVKISRGMRLVRTRKTGPEDNSTSFKTKEQPFGNGPTGTAAKANGNSQRRRGTVCIPAKRKIPGNNLPVWEKKVKKKKKKCIGAATLLVMLEKAVGMKRGDARTAKNLGGKRHTQKMFHESCKKLARHALEGTN